MKQNTRVLKEYLEDFYNYMRQNGFKSTISCTDEEGNILKYLFSNGKISFEVFYSNKTDSIVFIQPEDKK